MTDVQWLFLALTLLYAWESACWARRGTVGFRAWLGRRWRVRHPATLLGNQQGGFIFASVLPPLRPLLTAGQYPLSLSPEAVLAFVASSVNPGGRPLQSGRCMRWEDIRRVETRGKQVLVNGAWFLTAASPGWAAHLVRHLEELARQAPAKRAETIEILVESSFDTRAIRRRWEEFEQHTTLLRYLPNLLFAYLFVLAPLLIWRLGIERTWLPLLLALPLFTVPTALLFRRAHLHFFPEAAEERFTHFPDRAAGARPPPSAPPTSCRAHCWRHFIRWPSPRFSALQTSSKPSPASFGMSCVIPANPSARPKLRPPWPPSNTCAP